MTSPTQTTRAWPNALMRPARSGSAMRPHKRRDPGLAREIPLCRDIRPLAPGRAMAHTPAMIADPLAIGRGAQGVPPSPPPGTRVYAVGDIHGRADLLREINLLIHEDAYRRQAPRNVIVYLGDYIDRGDAPRGAIELLLNEPLPGFQSIHLRGNHEDILCRFLKDISVGPNWFAFGGLETLADYGVAPPEPVTGVTELQRTQRDLIARLPADHRNFLRRLPVSHTEGDY